MFMKHNSKQFGKQFYINPSNFVIELAFSPPSKYFGDTEKYGYLHTE
jgi:hypothetical protein